MIKLELYDTDRPLVIIQRDEKHPGAWARLQEALIRGVVGGAENRLDVKADVLLAELEVVREIRRTYSVDLHLGDRLRQRLQQLGKDRAQRENATSQGPLIKEEVQRLLTESGFKRPLKDFQVENLCRIAALPHGADFSVPGAGKTTVALAVFSISQALYGIERLLVVAPLAAFSAWKEDSVDCFTNPPEIGVHLGPGLPIPSQVSILLTNYHRLATDYDRIRSWVSARKTHLVLDEAHRVKRGRDGVHGTATLDMAFSAARRDVLTGTPAPQGAHDLVSLIRFLYPGQEKQILPPQAFVAAQSRDPQVLALTHESVKRFFVRTRKSDLDIPKANITPIRQPMGPIQKLVYSALVGKYSGTLSLDTQDRRSMRDLGLVLMYLLEAATNPLLITAGGDENDIPEFAHPPLGLQDDIKVTELLRRYGEFERPWKYQKVEEIVEEATKANEKVLVWSSFVRNLRFLKRELGRFNPAVVHGGIPPADGCPASAPTTREAELDRFRHDANCSVLLANPAACGEGVSLHHWCHHAVYLDRTFNAGQFLQSQDRIHRLGLDPATKTKFTLLISTGSIDETIEARLFEKVQALGILMDDPGLVKVALPELDQEGEGGGDLLESSDAEAIKLHLRGSIGG